MLCLALDHEETELLCQVCLKAANCWLSCDCPENEFASWSKRPGAPKLVEAVNQKIEDAPTKLLKAAGSIKRWCGTAEAESRPGKKRIESRYTRTTGSTSVFKFVFVML